MKEEIYLPYERVPFQIKFRDNLKVDNNKKFTFFHAVKFFTRIYTSGGKWWQTSIFLIFQMFLFVPIAFIFDLLTLIFAGILYGIGLLLFFLIKQIIKAIGVPVAIALSIIIVLIIGVLLYFHWHETINLINQQFNHLIR